jgi:mannonate dehydratase
MKITAARLNVCSPDRSFVKVRIETDEGVYCLGDATLNGRVLAVANYLEEHVIRCLIGHDPFQAETIWQYLYRGAYWRRGPVTMLAIAAVDVALWDIKRKALNTPVYNLLGGRSREGCQVYTHANGRNIPETMDLGAEAHGRGLSCSTGAGWGAGRGLELRRAEGGQAV